MASSCKRCLQLLEHLFEKSQLISAQCRSYVESRPLICSVNQWTISIKLEHGDETG